MKLIKEVFIVVVGKQSGEIVGLLDSKKYTNEFLIAEKLDITINQVRNILYKLADYGLVSSIRKKDKRKGWYTYFWKIEISRCLEFLKDVLTKEIDGINNQIRSRKTKQFYVCERCNVEFKEENALLYDFTCNECGDIFTMKDNTKALKEFNKNLDKLNRKLKILEEEINKEKDKIEKKRFKELKKEEDKKIKKRVSKKATKKKILNKIVKKRLKKKVISKKPKKKIIKKKLLKKKVVKKKVVKKK